MRTNPDGTVDRVDLSAHTWWDAKNVIGKLRGFASDKTMSVSAAEVNQESTSAGVLNIIKEAGAIYRNQNAPAPTVQPQPTVVIQADPALLGVLYQIYRTNHPAPPVPPPVPARTP